MVHTLVSWSNFTNINRTSHHFQMWGGWAGVHGMNLHRDNFYCVIQYLTLICQAIHISIGMGLESCTVHV